MTEISDKNTGGAGPGGPGGDRGQSGVKQIIRVNPEMVTTRTMLTDHRLQ